MFLTDNNVDVLDLGSLELGKLYVQVLSLSPRPLLCLTRRLKVASVRLLEGARSTFVTDFGAKESDDVSRQCKRRVMHDIGVQVHELMTRAAVVGTTLRVLSPIENAIEVARFARVRASRASSLARRRR